MAIAVLLKLDVPKVQDTGNDSKEMLIMGDIPLEHDFSQPCGVMLIFPAIN